MYSFNNRPNFGGGYSNMMDWGNAGKSMFNPTGLTAGNLGGMDGFDLSNLNIGGQQIAKGGMFDNMLGKDGWGNLALGGASMLGNLFMGMKQYGIAKDTLNFNKEQFWKQYDAQKNLTNSQLEDRQRARLAADTVSNSSGQSVANPNSNYRSVSDYMSQYGVK